MKRLANFISGPGSSLLTLNLEILMPTGLKQGDRLMKYASQLVQKYCKLLQSNNLLM